MEQWKDIPGFEGYYQVSDLGRVRSVDRTIAHIKDKRVRRLKGRILCIKIDNVCRQSIILSKHGQYTTRRIHRLVLESFVGPCPFNHQACHNDGNASNNTIENLRWDTKISNENDKIAHGTCLRNKVLRSDGVEFESTKVAAEKTPGTHQGDISRACQGKRGSSGGYRWQYV